ncbi:DUF294 nucleotidyltransferase-like domain-containing protein [Vibrio hippocampi]|uniref:Cyclic nucleotide-binding domain-containing protein n=1 Tax=Vibrio hippocampi TaxID=654686 RepID=A0ABN8DCR8_9VIBR|nr:DUF294 nucleotidyltransferase-like domain-containing protein [Vibrio hippocampi]CAH0524403.1 hypothetical protein VHP8226_00230 [Vibrio hippocampi]
MPDKFNMSSPPFDRLSVAGQKELRASLDVAYYRENELILRAGHCSQQLFVIIKGSVEERDSQGQEIYAHYTFDDMFDVRALLDGTTKHNYVALEDTLTYLIPKEVFTRLYQQNGQFAAYFNTSLAYRQQLLDQSKKQQYLTEFVLTKVSKEIYHPPLILSAQMSIVAATQELVDFGIDAALVELSHDDPRRQHAANPLPYGIITRTNLLHSLVFEQLDREQSIGRIATYPVHKVEHGDFLFNAMVAMTKQKVKRLMVSQGNQAVGMLDMTQILSAFSTHSHVITLSIARASSVDELALVSVQQRKLVSQLINNGVRTRFMMELTSAINDQIIEKAFELVLPPAMQGHCCLMVMGSEGRCEQILKTDQDNALIIREGLEWPNQDATLKSLTHTLARLGYPLCPGEVMVSNVQWVKSLPQWQQHIDHLVSAANPNAVMELAILADARPVAGNSELFQPVKQHLTQTLVDKEQLLSEFTRPAINFALPLTLFGNVKSEKGGLDIKQGGIFPIIHGVRALSLEYGISATNTFERIEALVSANVLETSTADNLSEALKQLLKLRLHQQLSSQETTNTISLQQLDRPERDLLRHSLHIVKKFKQWLGYHYQIRH